MVNYLWICRVLNTDFWYATLRICVLKYSYRLLNTNMQDLEMSQTVYSIDNAFILILSYILVDFGTKYQKVRGKAKSF